MSRGLRLHVPDVSVHVLSRGNNKQSIFTDDVDHQMYLSLLERESSRFQVQCHAHCLLVTHAHLLVTPSTRPLSNMMRQLNSHYCQWFNKRHERVGHVLQGRYRSLMVEDGSYFLNALRYIALNPVVARRVNDPSEWRWSSYRAMMGIDPAPEFLRFDRIWRMVDAESEVEGRDRVGLFMASSDRPEVLWGSLIRGSAAFAKRVAPFVEPHRGNGAFTYAERFATRPPLAELLKGLRPGTLLEDAVRVAFSQHAYTLREIGAVLGIHPSTVWTWIKRSERRGP